MCGVAWEDGRRRVRGGAGGLMGLLPHLKRPRPPSQAATMLPLPLSPGPGAPRGACVSPWCLQLGTTPSPTPLLSPAPGAAARPSSSARSPSAWWRRSCGPAAESCCPTAPSRPPRPRRRPRRRPFRRAAGRAARCRAPRRRRRRAAEGPPWTSGWTSCPASLRCESVAVSVVGGADSITVCAGQWGCGAGHRPRPGMCFRTHPRSRPRPRHAPLKLGWLSPWRWCGLSTPPPHTHTPLSDANV